MKTVGQAWIRKTDEGKKLLLKLKIKFETLSLILSPNENKETEKDADFIVYEQEDENASKPTDKADDKTENSSEIDVITVINEIKEKIALDTTRKQLIDNAGNSIYLTALTYGHADYCYCVMIKDENKSYIIATVDKEDKVMNLSSLILSTEEVAYNLPLILFTSLPIYLSYYNIKLTNEEEKMEFLMKGYIKERSENLIEQLIYFKSKEFKNEK